LKLTLPLMVLSHREGGRAGMRRWLGRRERTAARRDSRRESKGLDEPGKEKAMVLKVAHVLSETGTAKWGAGGVVPASPESLAPGIYFNEVISLPHPIQLVLAGAPRLLAEHPTAVGSNAGTYFPSLLRFFPARGNEIWSGRTTTCADSESNIVRLLTARIAQSLDHRLRWAVFENNGSQLWAMLVSTIENYLQSMLQEGALPGKKHHHRKCHDSFFVRCGSDTMTQDDLDAGRFVLIVGFAPLRPSEFIVLQVTGQTKKK
jgi:hypothetical protein